MKIRNGFVSNSSSSSFCIVGVFGELGVKMLMEELGVSADVRPNHGEDCECKKCKAYNNALNSPSRPPDRDLYSYSTPYGRFRRTDNKMFQFAYYGTPYCIDAAGIEAKEILKDMTLVDAKKFFVKEVKRKLGLDINYEDVDLLFGEAGE